MCITCLDVYTTRDGATDFDNIKSSRYILPFANVTASNNWKGIDAGHNDK